MKYLLPLVCVSVLSLSANSGNLLLVEFNTNSYDSVLSVRIPALVVEKPRK